MALVRHCWYGIAMAAHDIPQAKETLCTVTLSQGASIHRIVETVAAERGWYQTRHYPYLK